MAVLFPIEIPKDCEFGYHNIPFGIFSVSAENTPKPDRKACTAIGDYVLDLSLLERHGILSTVGLTRPVGNVFNQPTLNEFAAFPAKDRSLVRATIINELSDEKSPLFTNADLNRRAFLPRTEVQMHFPMDVGHYSDSFCSLIHAKNSLAPLGIPLVPAWYDFPMAYYGRNSGLAVSGTDVVRPSGIYPAGDGERARLHPTQKLDFEIELAFFISAAIPKGTIVPAKDAAEHIFGFVLLNDWSARDIQKHEMAPLGVFHSKSFQTSISPWIITLDALKGSPAGPPQSHETDIELLLKCDTQDHGIFDLDFSAKVSRNGAADVTIAESNFKYAYWSPYQMVAYHSLSGSGISTGDLLGTGTHSSPVTERRTCKESAQPSTAGCLVEVFGLGDTLPEVGGKPMGWLEDGDRLTIEAWFNTPDGGRAGFGPLTGLILPSKVDNVA